MRWWSHRRGACYYCRQVRWRGKWYAVVFFFNDEKAHLWLNPIIRKRFVPSLSPGASRSQQQTKSIVFHLIKKSPCCQVSSYQLSGFAADTGCLQLDLLRLCREILVNNRRPGDDNSLHPLLTFWLGRPGVVKLTPPLVATLHDPSLWLWWIIAANGGQHLQLPTWSGRRCDPLPSSVSSG